MTFDGALAGPENERLLLSLDEQRNPTYRKSESAMPIKYLPNGQRVYKVSITPLSGETALNFTLQRQTDQKFLSTPVRLPEIWSAIWHLSKHSD
jgi:ATP-dependent Zn protease